MKRYLAAAGALLLGTSAMAWAPPAETVDSKWTETGAKMSLSATDLKAQDQMKIAVLDTFADAKADMASDAMAWADTAFKAEPAAWTSAAPKLQPDLWTASAPKLQPAAASWSEEAPAIENADISYGDWKSEDGADAKADLAESDDKADDAVAGEDEAEAPPAPIVEERGIGGPEEAIAGDLAPRPAARNYPPCDPGPGDDNCIQLYEPGVRTALASWNAPTGGLLDGRADTAMGGPFEPVETAEAMPVGQHQAAADSGMGGPIRETGYPPCSGSPTDDRCIQLYEPGVTGEGN